METYFIYRSHRGGYFYGIDLVLTDDELECDCGDGDEFLGTLTLDREPLRKEMSRLYYDR